VSEYVNDSLARHFRSGTLDSTSREEKKKRVEI
jgi:hypothetical protein